MTVQGWTVFNTANTNATTITTDTFVMDGTMPYYEPVYYRRDGSAEGSAVPEEPLAWLRRRVDETVALGRLS